MLVEIGGSQEHKHPCGSHRWPFLAELHGTSPALSWHGTLVEKLLWDWDGEGNPGCEKEGQKGRHLLPCTALPGPGRDWATVF